MLSWVSSCWRVSEPKTKGVDAMRIVLAPLSLTLLVSSTAGADQSQPPSSPLRLAALVELFGPASVVAIATVLATWWATHQAHRLDRDRREKSEAKELEVVLRGIHAEIATVMDRYRSTVGNELERERNTDREFGGYLTAQQGYFSLYEQSGAVLGRLEDAELLQSIIATYTLMRAMIDSHIIQHEILSTSKGQRDTNWRSRAKAHKTELLSVHDQVTAASNDVLERLEARHGPIR